MNSDSRLRKPSGTAARADRWPSVLALLGGMLLVAGASYLLWVRATQNASAADAEASVIAAVLAIVGAATAIFEWARRRRQLAALPVTAEQEEQAAANLARMVYEQWRAEVRARSLDDPQPMPVRWRLTAPKLMDHPEVILPHGTLELAGSSDRIGDVRSAFMALPRRRLVIVGGPGSGKTTLAIQLLLELLDHPRPGDPVPVMFTVADWDPDTYARVQDWLAAELNKKYRPLRAISAGASAALADRDRLLPILDGLDEVPLSRRAAIIRALNTSLGPAGLILTSRRTEYEAALADAGDVLTGAATIGPYTLTGAQAATYLDRHLPPAPGRDPGWDQVLASLAGGTAPLLSKNTSTPLGLWLVRIVIIDGRRSPEILTDTVRLPTSAALQGYLLDQLIPATVDARPPLPRRRRDAPQAPLHPARRHQKDDLRRWLTTLAEHLRDNGTPDWVWWEFSRIAFPPRRMFWLYLIFGLVGALLAWPLHGPLLGLAAGLAIAYMTTNGPAPHPRRYHSRPSVIAMELLAKVQFAGALTLLVVLGANLPTLGLSYQLESSLAAVLTILAAGRVVSEFDLGATEVFGATASDSSVSPSRSHKEERIRTLIDLLGSILAVGLTAGILLMLQLGSGYTEIAGIDRGFRMPADIVIAISVVVVAGALVRSAWFRFVCATVTWTLRRPSRLPAPWRLMGVLEDAHRLGLLRTMGSAYQFRHAALQDHLAPRRTA